MKKRVITIIGLSLLLLAAIDFFILNLPTVGVKTIKFDSSYKGSSVTLSGSLWETQNAEYAVLICPGYSCDRQKWRPMADLLVSNGFTVMSFDYAGQGASYGAIGFDNAKTDAIPVEIADAIETLHTKTGIAYDHIILMGHSMGGRSILRLLYDYNDETAETTITKTAISNVILLSPEVNYNYNAQASLFAGTSDDAEEPWHSYNAAYSAGINVYLFGSVHDDIVSADDVKDIYSHLGGENADSAPLNTIVSTVNSVGAKITMGITSGVLHSYEMYSPKFVKFVNRALSEISGTDCNYGPWHFTLVYAGWFLSLLGLLFTLTGLNMGLEWKAPDTIPALDNPRKYLLRKLLMWLPASLLAFIICCITIVMPFGSPVMNTPYMCFIAGYGLLMLFLYKKGFIKGVTGKLPKLSLGFVKDRRDLIEAAAVSVALCIFVWYALRSTMYRLIPLNARLFWVIFATILMAVGYYVSGVEADMLEKAKANIGIKFLYNLIQYVPLFLLVLFYMILKSYSGMIGQVQNMLLMYIFCVPLGNFVKKKTGNRLLGACLSAFLFQTIMITSAALIAMF